MAVQTFRLPDPGEGLHVRPGQRLQAHVGPAEGHRVETHLNPTPSSPAAP